MNTKQHANAHESMDNEVRVEILDAGRWRAYAGDRALEGAQMFGREVVGHRQLARFLGYASGLKGENKCAELIQRLVRIGKLNHSHLIPVMGNRADGKIGRGRTTYYLSRIGALLVVTHSETKIAIEFTQKIVEVFDAVVFGDSQTRGELEQALVQMQELRTRDHDTMQVYEATVARLHADLDQTRADLEASRSGTGVIGIAKARRLLAQIRDLAGLGVMDGRRKAIEIEVAKLCGHPQGRPWSQMLEAQLGLATQAIQDLLKSAPKPVSRQMPMFN
jgi:hypothetical protein